MKPRPPSLRFKKRYVLAVIIPQWRTTNTRQLQQKITESISTLVGDVGIAQILPTIVFYERGFIIVRCRRGTERMLTIALSTVISDGMQRIAVRSIATSGTILALKRKIILLSRDITEANLNMNDREYLIYKCFGQKVDLLEKGIKSQEILFLTEKDLEEM